MLGVFTPASLFEEVEWFESEELAEPASFFAIPNPYAGSEDYYDSEEKSELTGT